MKTITLKHLEDICGVTEKLFDIYGELSDAELNNKKNTQEYKNLLEKLYLLREEEYSYYKYFIENLNEAGKAVRYLTGRSNKDLEAATNVAVRSDEQEIKQYRIITRLHLIALMDDNYFLNDVDEDLLTITTGKNHMEFLHDSWIMDGQEINYRTVSFCESIMDDDVLFYTSMKYIMAFLCPMIESEYCKNNFNRIKRDFDNHIIKPSMGVTEAYANYVHLVKGLDNACVVLGVLLDFSDSELDSPDASVEFNMFLAEFKASLLFLDDEGMQDVQEEFNDVINMDKYLEEHEDDENVRSTIQDVISNFEIERKYANEDNNLEYKKSDF